MAKKFTALFLLLSLLLFAREEISPTKNCPAFNNMKHSTNTHNVFVEPSRRYPLLDRHKGQILLLVKGEQPAQRWVDEACFSSSETLNSSVDSAIERIDKTHAQTSDTKKYDNQVKPKEMLLALSWHNAFCETHRSKKECKRNRFLPERAKQHEERFILHGFWPQPRNNIYCNVERKYITMDKYGHWNKLPKLDLTDETRAKLTKIMPGVNSNLHRHEWIKHGTCYGTDAERYFKESIALTEQFYDSEVSRFFEKNIGKRVTLKQVRRLFDRSFGEGAGRRVAFRCKNGLITELWLHLGSGSDDLGTLLKKGKQTRSRCDRGLIDKAGFSNEVIAKADFTKETSIKADFLKKSAQRLDFTKETTLKAGFGR